MAEARTGEYTGSATEDESQAADELERGEERQGEEADEQRAAGTEEITYREALRRALREELLHDERVFLIGEEIGIFGGSYKVTSGLFDDFGSKRIREAPISEEGFTGLATGAAMTGLRPVVEIMTINFILVAMDQVINHTAKVRYMFSGQVGCPMVIRTPNGAGNQLTAQHSQNLENWFAHVPGLKVVTPATPADAKGLLKAAIRDDDPVVVVENLPAYNLKGTVSGDPDYTTPIGEAKVTREGDDITLIGHSMAAQRSLEVAEQLEQEEISVEVIDLRSLRPLDMETVARSLAKTNRALCVDEGWPTYGVSAELCARIQAACFDDLDAPIGRVGMAEVPMAYAKNLENATLPHEKKIRAAALAVLGEGTDPEEWRAG